MRSPAPHSTITSWPAPTTRATPSGTMPTRRSPSLTSRGTPTRIASTLAIAAADAVDEFALGGGVIGRLADPGFDDLLLACLIRIAQRRICAQRVTKLAQGRDLFGIRVDQVNVQPKRPTLVRDGANAHRPIFGKHVSALLALEAELIDGSARRFQPSQRIHGHQIDHAFAGATGNRGAANMLDAGPWRSRLDQLSNAHRDADGGRIVFHVRRWRDDVRQDGRLRNHATQPAQPSAAVAPQVRCSARILSP